MGSSSYLALGNLIILAIFVLVFWNTITNPIWVVYWIITAAVYSFIVWGFFGLITMHRRVKNSWHQIDVQLKKRSDLVPSLVETVKGYLKHERGVIKDITEARKKMSTAQTPQQKAAASTLLSATLGKFFALAEAVPELKASENFKLLQEQLEGIESNIAYSRQFYNDSVMRYDTAVSSSHLIFAKMLGYRANEFPYFEAKGTERKKPEVKF